MGRSRHFFALENVMSNINQNQPNRTYQQRVEAKKDRFEALAHHAAAESNTTFSRAQSLGASIPFGQPILIGHHSERSDRNYRARISSTYQKALDLQGKAEHYAHKAAVVGTGGISSDDPDAITKLTTELEKRQLVQTRMKEANKIKAGNYASFELSNNNAQIVRITKRIAQLSANAKRVDAEIIGQGYRCNQDTSENRMMFIFDAKPGEAMRTILKNHAFKWSPNRNAWVRMLNNASVRAAKDVMKALDQMNGATN